MQIIRKLGSSLGKYIQDFLHRKVSAPENCPLCGNLGCLAALGYYERNVTDLGKVRTILVRRFRCSDCGRTTSILPSFAQPYRLIQNDAIESFFSQSEKNSNFTWKYILSEYWKRFSRWIPSLVQAIGVVLPRSPPFENTLAWWEVLAAGFGTLEEMTNTLVERFGITPFGRYKCHNSNI